MKIFQNVRNIKKHLTIYGLICLLGVSCSTDDSEETLVLRMNHHQQTAVGMGPALVYLTQQNEAIGTEQWLPLHDEIAGFDYEPGYIYDLLVTKEFIGYTIIDGSSVQYSLQKIIAKEKVAADTRFEITLKSVAMIDPPEFVTGNAASGFNILNSIGINCGNLCDDLEQLLATEDELSGIFKHQSGTEEIELLELKINWKTAKNY